MNKATSTSYVCKNITPKHPNQDTMHGPSYKKIQKKTPKVKTLPLCWDTVWWSIEPAHRTSNEEVSTCSLMG